MAFAHSGPNWIEITPNPETHVIPGAATRPVAITDGIILLGFDQEPDDATVFFGWAESQDEEALALYGVKAISEPEPAGPGHLVLGHQLVDVGGTPHRQWIAREKELHERKADAQAQRLAAYETVMNDGFPHSFEGVDETLQVRDQDKANWLTLKDACDDAIEAGAGAVVSALPIRCTSNRSYHLSYLETRDLLVACRTWAAQQMGLNWALADGIEAAESAEELAAIDPSAAFGLA